MANWNVNQQLAGFPDLSAYTVTLSLPNGVVAPLVLAPRVPQQMDQYANIPTETLQLLLSHIQQQKNLPVQIPVHNHEQDLQIQRQHEMARIQNELRLKVAKQAMIATEARRILTRDSKVIGATNSSPVSPSQPQDSKVKAEVPKEVVAKTKMSVDDWKPMFELLREYKREHGHANVPRNEVFAGKPLGAWLHYQRKVFRRLGVKTINNVTKEDAILLRYINRKWKVTTDKSDEESHVIEE